MKESTINFALHVLDAQLNNVLSCKTEDQRSYYAGAMLMFNLLVSDGYETNKRAEYDDTGHHYVVNE